MTIEDLVHIDRRGSVAIVTLNRPEAMNALSQALSARIAQSFATLAMEREVRVAILTGKGRAFCAGMDLKELSSGAVSLQSPDEDHGPGHRRFGMSAFPGPVIAAINGFAITGGLELALCCDIRIAAQGATFADTHARVGVIPGGRMSALLPRLIGPGRAKMMSLGCSPIDVETAARWGLVDQVVEPERLIPAALALAEAIAANDAGMVQRYKTLIDENYGLTYSQAVDNEHHRSQEANQRFDRRGIDPAAITRHARTP